MQLEKFRTQLALERSLKKSDNEHFAKQIKSTTLSAAKEHYKKLNLARAEAHNRRIEALSKEIEQIREMMINE